MTETTEHTIDELASLSGVPSRTVRFYQSRGALMAPEMPAASAKGTVSPSDIPITMSLTVSPPRKCSSR